MKKSNLFVLAAAVAMLASCGSSVAPSSSSSSEAVPETLYFGLGAKASYAAKGTDPVFTVQTDVTVGGFLFDADGKILKSYVDVMQVKSKANDATTSVLTSKVNADTDTKSKRELGNAYGMVTHATKGEWYTQADAWQAFVVGKTAAEAVAADDTDGLKASVTITTTDFSFVATEAWANKVQFSSLNADSLMIGVGMYGEHAALMDTIDFAAVAFDGNKIVSSATDAFQIPYVITSVGTVEVPAYSLAVNATKSQVVTADSTIKSKVELGAGYNMKTYGGATYEWFEQAANLAAYLKGKTVVEGFFNSEVVVGAETGTYYTAAEKTVAKVTISLDGFIKVYREAYVVAL